MANEKRLIDANALKKKGFYDLGAEEAIVYVEDIDEAPTVDAVEVVHGYNVRQDWPSLFGCSICHWSDDDTYTGDTSTYNYCPNCGAKMDGDGNA